MSLPFPQLAGWLILAAIAIRALVQAMGTMRRVSGERKQEQLASLILSHQLENARQSLKKVHDKGNTWNGWRKFQVRRKISESPDITSFYLVPHDNKQLPPYQPGQYLTL